MSNKKMTPEQIEEFNKKVEYNESGFSWIVDIICAFIFWPMILTAIYRRCKYDKKIIE